MARVVAAAFVLLLVGCESGAAPSGKGGAPKVPFARSGSVDPDRIAARVDGEPITLDDVEDLVEMSDGGLGAGEALGALVEQQLLAREAWRRGHRGGSALEIERRRAMARALLGNLGEELTAEDVPLEDIRQFYEERKTVFVHPPLRDVVHAVALTGEGKLSDREAEDLARRAAEAVAGAADARAFQEALKPLRSGEGKGVLKVEDLPPFPGEGSGFDEVFVEAVWGLQGPGSISVPVRTRFGWHVIMMQQDIPERNSSFEEARREIAEGLLPAFKKRETERAIEKLGEKTGVKIYDARLETESGGPGG